MAWTAPRTWVTGEVVTASIMNTHVRDNLLSTSRLLAADHTDVTVVNSAVETTLATFTVPANAMGTKNALVVDLMGVYTQNVSIGGTFRMKYGATTVLSLAGQLGANSASQSGFRLTSRMLAANSTSSQDSMMELFVGPFNGYNTFTAGGASSESSTSAKTFSLTWQWDSASGSASLSTVLYTAVLHNLSV